MDRDDENNYYVVDPLKIVGAAELETLLNYSAYTE
jgi:hypothetical protein